MNPAEAFHQVQLCIQNTYSTSKCTDLANNLTSEIITPIFIGLGAILAVYGIMYLFVGRQRLEQPPTKIVNPRFRILK